VRSYKPEVIVATGPKPGLGPELVFETVDVSCVVWIGSSRVGALGKEHGSVPRTRSESRAAGVLCPWVLLGYIRFHSTPFSDLQNCDTDTVDSRKYWAEIAVGAPLHWSVFGITIEVVRVCR
jgi:hypothetical protein